MMNEGEGLLARIAARTNQQQSQAQEQQQAISENERKPDAIQQGKAQRGSYSQAMASAPDQQMEEESASPEEQAQFTEMERAMAEAVYGEKASHSIIKAVKAAPDPVDGVGKVSKDLVMAISKKFPDVGEDVLLGIGESAVEQVVDLVESADPSISLNEDQMAEAFSIALTSWMEANPGSVSGDMMQYMNEPAPQQLAPQGQPPIEQLAQTPR